MLAQLTPPLPVDVRPDLVDWLTAAGTLGAVALAAAVAIVEAARARTARQERDAVVAEQQAAERRATARLVSAWIEQFYEPLPDGTSYVQHVFAHLINESDSPVFQLSTSIILTRAVPDGKKPITIGPLSVPSPIPVLPPRRELHFDISIPLHAHRNEDIGALPDIPGIEIGFTDPNDVRWVRELDGRLVQADRSPGHLFASTDDETAARQLGRLDASNPMAIVLAFLDIMTDDQVSDAAAAPRLQDVLAPEATGWNDLDPAAVADMRSELADYRIGTHVVYPAPTVAYVKIIESDSIDLQIAVDEGVVIAVKMVTLTFHPDRGWRIFTYGGAGTPPDRIHFPDGVM